MTYKKSTKKETEKKEKKTTIAIPLHVKERIEEYGLKGETYAEIIERLLKSARERLLYDVLLDTSNCISIGEAREELEKRWPRSK